MPPTPPWVDRINSALESGAAAFVLTYVAVDLGTAFVLLVLFIALRVNVSATFALAFAISKSPPLRGARLALDAAVAAALTRFYPPLASVRVSLLADAMARLASLDELSERLSGIDVDVAEPAAPSKRKQRLARAAQATRKLTDEFGLAYLVVKNVVGPLSIFGIFAVIRSCTGGNAVGSVIAGRNAERFARVVLGPGGSAFDGVKLPSVGQTAGCVALASTLSSLLFPLVVLGAAALTPAVGRAANALSSRMERNEGS